VLNRVLGNFIENLEKDQLKVSFFSGTINLENLQVKRTLFDAMPLPFKLHYGKVGKIHIKVPVMNIFNSPLIVEISDVFVFVKPKHFEEWKESVEVEAFQRSTLNSLQKYEDYLQEREQLEQKHPGMMQNLVTRIIDNLQVKISNVVVRLEDELSLPYQPFALSAIVGQVEARTCNEKWQPKFVGN